MAIMISDNTKRSTSVTNITAGLVVCKPACETVGTKEKYGHIVRFSRSILGELLLFVRWEDGEEYDIHPADVTIFLR